MAEMIQKLSPHRTMHLQGFDGYGCTASLHHASATGFTISGGWGEQDDFVVLVLWDADNQLEHSRARYLPDTEFDGISLDFDLKVTNCVRIDSDLFPWIDWAFLNVIFTDGTVQQIRLSDHVTYIGAFQAATAAMELTGSPHALDVIELAWFDQHFNYKILGVDTLESAASALAQVISSNQATCGVSATPSGSRITLTWTGIAGNPLLGRGYNGNRIGVYGMVSGAGTEQWSPTTAWMGGGLSPGLYTISLNLGSLLTQPLAVQKMWLTFAPPISFVAPFENNNSTQGFEVLATNWTVTDANNKRALKVAGPGSVRIEETSPWVVRSGYWEDAPADGFAFWSGGRAIRSAYNAGETRRLTIETHCQGTHDIYVGTRVDGSSGIVSASLDGGAPVTLDCYGSAAQVRRRLFSSVTPGKHSVTITISSGKNALSAGWYFYFDFLECAILGDVPDAPEVRTDVAVATDYDTDNTYKLSPQRLIWGIQKSGLVGPIDHYCGVFWWPTRKMLTAPSTWSQVTVITFSGTPQFGKRTWLVMGATTLEHVELFGDTAETTAIALMLLVNQGSTVFWAEAQGAVLTLRGLAGSANYHIAVSVTTNDTGFTATVVTTNANAVPVEWGVDDSSVEPMNSAVLAWHADYFAGLVSAGMSAVVSFSQELVNPPVSWVQKFFDGTPVSTATGFGTLASSQCCFSAAVAAYMASVYSAMAALMVTAGLPVRLQFGEVGWWFNAGGSPLSMAYYDADTGAAWAGLALGRGLHVFAGPGDDPAVNSYVDANFLRGRLKSYVDAVRSNVLSAYSGVAFEILWPLDVNDPDTRRLNRYVNLPAEWTARSGSGWDTFVCEGFEYAGVMHNIDKSGRCSRYAFTELSWDKAHCRYLMGWYYSGWPWTAEYLKAFNAGVPLIKMWAFDHLCLMGWPLPLPNNPRTATVT